jgi:hypothetical protein
VKHKYPQEWQIPLTDMHTLRPLKSRLNAKVTCFITVVTSQKIIISHGFRVRGLVTMDSLMKYLSHSTITTQKLKLSIYKSNTKVRSQSQICWYPQEDLVSRNIHVKYQSPSTYHSKDIDKVRFFCMSVKHRGQGHKVKPISTQGKVLSQ